MTIPSFPYSFREVPRLHRPSSLEMNRRKHEMPLALTGCMENSKLLSDLRNSASHSEKLQILCRLLGDQTFHHFELPVSHGGSFHLDEQGYETYRHCDVFRDDPEQIPASRFITEKLAPTLADRSRGTLYMVGPVPSTEYMFRDLPMTADVDGKYAGRQLWLGSGGQIMNLHYDLHRNYIFMFEGVKRVAVFPHKNLKCFYPAPFDRTLAGPAQSTLVQLLNYDRKKYPMFEQLFGDALITILRPGEILYIPPFWWHHVESFDVNLSINIFSGDVPANLPPLLLDAFMEALAIFSDTPPRLRVLYQQLYAAYAFGTDVSNISCPADEAPYVPRQRVLDRITTNLVQLAVLCANLPEYWRAYGARMFDYYVFRLDGDPFPTLPGEYQKMVARLCAKYITAT